MSAKQMFYLSNFSEANEEVQEGKLTKRAELFSIGTHRGVEYTEDDLHELAKNFNAQDNIPVQLDHSESARDTVGYLKEVEVKDGKLLGIVDIIDEYAQERITKKLMNKLSISFYKKETPNGAKPFRIREVSLVAFPQIKGAQLFSENNYVSEIEEGDKGGKQMSEQFDLEKFKEEQKAILEAEIQEQFAELKEKAKLAEDLQVQFNEQKVSSMVEKFQESQTVIPAQVDSLKTLLSSFSEEQMKAFEEFMSNASKVDFQEQGEVDGEGQKDEGENEPSEFDKFYEEYTKRQGSTL